MTKTMIWVLGIVIVVCIIAYTVMKVLKVEGEEMFSFIVPSLIGIYASYVATVVNRKMDAQDEQIAEVKHQTNGIIGKAQDTINHLTKGKIIAEQAGLIHDSDDTEDDDNKGVA